MAPGSCVYYCTSQFNRIRLDSRFFSDHGHSISWRKFSKSNQLPVRRKNSGVFAISVKYLSWRFFVEILDGSKYASNWGKAFKTLTRVNGICQQHDGNYREFRSNHRSCSVRKFVLRNFTKFAGKHLCLVFFKIKLQTWDPGAKRGCLKCSIRGTNNQIRNRFYKSVHLQLFNVKYKFVYLQLFNVKYKFIQLQLFDVKFLFSEEHIFRKQKRTDVYGRASLVSGFQLNRENDDLLSSRHK